VSEERLTVDGRPRFTRRKAQADSNGGTPESGEGLIIDWIGLQLVALPLVQEAFRTGFVVHFQASASPHADPSAVANLIKGDSEVDTLEPNVDLKDLGAWFAGLLAHAPSAYRRIDEYVKQVMPDVRDMKSIRNWS